jgi:hypothetical protein
VKETEEAPAEAKAEGGADVGLEAEAGVVEADAVDALAQLLEVGGIDRNTSQNTTGGIPCSRAAGRAGAGLVPARTAKCRHAVVQ